MSTIARQVTKAAVFGAIATVKRPIAGAELRHRANGHPLRIMLGAGPHQRDGWISTDIAIRHPATVYLNIAQRFALEDASVDAYFAEHVIEHIPFEVGADMLAEIARTLQPGGVARIATPDLRQVTRCLQTGDNEAGIYTLAANRGWNRRATAPVVPEPEIENPCFAVNRMFYQWGHRFIYDEPTLRSAMERAGLRDVTRCEVGESAHPHMRDLERHGDAIDPTVNRFETMVLEAVKN